MGPRGGDVGGWRIELKKVLLVYIESSIKYQQLLLLLSIYCFFIGVTLGGITGLINSASV